MKNLIRHKIFIATFLAAYLSFFALTIFILDLKSEGISVGHTEYGFPLTYYFSHCFGGHYLWLGLIGNILIAEIFSFVIGLVLTHFWLKFSSSEFSSK